MNIEKLTNNELNSNNSGPSLVELLQKNNEYLQKLLQLKQKEHRQQIIFQTIHIFITLIPWIATLILAYLMWQTILHYFEIVNNNLNVLKSNFDTLHTFIQKITPDFSGVIPKIKETWQNLPFVK